MSLDAALEYWQVHEEHEGPQGWYAVSNAMDSIVAYFNTERDAFRYRLWMINRELNP